MYTRMNWQCTTYHVFAVPVAFFFKKKEAIFPLLCVLCILQNLIYIIFQCLLLCSYALPKVNTPHGASVESLHAMFTQNAQQSAYMAFCISAQCHLSTRLCKNNKDRFNVKEP